MDAEDPIMKLLQQTGWSYAEILKKLEAYKDEFPTNSQSKTDDKEAKKENNTENTNSVKDENSDSNDDKKEDVKPENDIEDNTEIRTDTEKPTHSNYNEKEKEAIKIEGENSASSDDININKEENAEPKGNKDDAELNTDKENCSKLNNNKHLEMIHNKEHPDEQENTNLTDNKNTELDENLKRNSKSEKDEKEKMERGIEKSESEDSRDEELESIIERLERFIEENEESNDNEEDFAKFLQKKSESEKNEEIKLKNVEPEEKCDNATETGRNGNSKNNKEEKLFNITKDKSNLENNEAKLDDITEQKSESSEKINVVKQSEKIHEGEKLENIELQSGSEVELESGSDNKRKDVLRENSESKEAINNETMEQTTEFNSGSETDEEQNLDKILENDRLSEDNIKNKLKSIIERLEKTTEEKSNSEDHGEERLQELELENDHDKEKLDKIAQESSKSDEEINKSVEKSKEIVEQSTQSQNLEEKLGTAMKHNLESATNKEEIPYIASENNSDSEDSEEDKLDNIIERLEKVIKERAELEDDEEENLQNTEWQSEKKESSNPHDVEGSTHPNEPANPDVPEDKSLNILKIDTKTKSTNQANRNIAKVLPVKINVNSSVLPNQTKSEKATSKNLKRYLINMRLRIVRKYKITLNRKIKKRKDNKPKVAKIKDIRSKLREQLELLRTKRKAAELPLISAPPMSRTVKFPQRNLNRLNTITNNLIQKLNTKRISEAIHESDSDTEMKDSLGGSEIQAQPGKNHKGPEENVVLSNETDLMIISVIGGYKSPTHETRFDDDNVIDVEGNGETKKNDLLTDVFNNDQEDKRVEDQDFLANGITPTKTTDVTKIKGWKNKKFAIARKEGQRKPSDKLLYQLMVADSEHSDLPQHCDLDNKAVEEPHPTVPSTEKPENTNQTKSAFISDELDQYLTENSELNISYEVPKLEAEQTITTKYIDIKFPEMPQKNIQPSHTKNSKDSYKPKTLAEKRKMLAEAEKPEIRDFMLGMNSKQRKDYEQSVLSMRKKLIEEDIPFTRRCFMTSTTITNTQAFVVYNGKKLKVPSNKNREILAQIKEKRKIYKSLPLSLQQKDKFPKVQRQRKPSLLSELRTDTTAFPYDPIEWETVQMKLPKLTLEIKPQIGKRIFPRLEHLIQNDDHISLTQNRVEFALSTLKVKNSTPKQQIFTFPLSYKNGQTHITLRRRCPIVIDLSAEVAKPIETDNEIAKAVNDVVNKMLDYIDVSEQTKDIIRDESETENDEKPDLPIQTQNPDKNWRRRKRRVVYGEKGVHRTTLEMKRLNCKIVSISLDEENGEIQPCMKEFCKLGCICKSLECSSTNLLLSHCGLSRCMFGCKCKHRNMGTGDNFSLPAGTDIFSEGIINRLQDEAKKNLAKVEKEFTQTVIRTNKQIIMVGDSKDRRRRATKMPKKYIDFVEEDPDDKPTSKYVAAESKYRSLTERSPTERSPTQRLVAEPCENAVVIKTTEDDTVTKPCSIKLMKYDLSGIMPFCLVHLLYKCHCKNKAVFNNNIVDKNIVACTYVNPPKPILQPEPPTKNKLKPKIYKTFNKELYSSRTRGLATSYYLIRNKSLSHKCKIKKGSKKLQKALEIYLRQNAAKIMQENMEATIKAFKQLPEVQEPPKEPKRKRKQSLIVLEDPGSEITTIDLPDHATELLQHNVNDAERELKLQRRKAKSNMRLTGQEILNIQKNSEESLPTLPTGLFGDTKKLKTEFLALLGKKTSQLRLLPWITLEKRYQNGSFQVWYSNTSRVCPLVITENGKRPTNHHYNIKLFEHMRHESAMPSEVIRWLITRRVPLERSPENILLVLSYNRSYWEICGLCEKNQTDPKTKENISISLIDSWNSTENNSDTTPDIAVELAAIEPAPIDVPDDVDTNENSMEKDQNLQEETETIVHENLQENKKVMYCSKRRFQSKKLVSDETHDDDSLKIRQVLWAPIPSVTLACKWRVIYMNLGFAYLSLSRSSYTIKYDDIMRAMKLANSEKLTVVLKSEELQKNYPHRNFGIYCVHNYIDKIFVGPYFLSENHDLDTLSFVNNVLVNTNLFNQIKGKSVPGSGRWFHQDTGSDEKSVDDDVMIVQDPAPVVDLTCESDEDPSDVKKDDSSVEDASKNQSTLLKSMLLTPLAKASSQDTQEEYAKAEKALDTLLRKGQINVNKTLVQLDNLKSFGRIGSSIQPTSQINSKATTSNNVSVKEDQDAVAAADPSESHNEERLVIDEDATENHNISLQVDGKAGTIANPTKKGIIGSDLQVNRYLVTNIPGLGYISAYQHENTKIVDVVCPITKKMKRFSTPEAAISALERVFTNKFIRVPTTFKIEFHMLEKLENSTDVPLDRSVLYGYHIVGSFGVRNLLHCTATELENFGLDKVQITHMWKLFEKKLLWTPICQLGKLLAIPVKETAIDSTLSDILSGTVKEIRTLQKDSALFIREKIDLESKKVCLAEKCSKLQYQLPPEQRIKAQQELDRIINFSNRQISLNNSANTSGNSLNSKTKIADVSDPIILDDDDDPQNNSKNTPTSKSFTLTAPMKFKLTKGGVSSGTSLLSGKKVEMPPHGNQRSLLASQLTSPQKDNSGKQYVVVQRKRNSAGNLISTTNTVDLSKCTFQIKSSKTEEKLLVKEVPIKVRKDMLEAANNSILQLNTKPKPVLISNVGSVKKTSQPSKSVLTNIPTISRLPKVNPGKGFVSGNKTKFILPQGAKLKNVNAVPSTVAPMVPTTSKSIGDLIKTSTMATITPISKSPGLVLTNSTAKSTPNYIAIREGNNFKYFQLVSESKSPVLQPVQAIKRPASSIMIQPPLKKISSPPAPPTSLLTNHKTEK